MPRSNPLPGGPQSTPALEKVRIEHGTAEAQKAAAKNDSYTPTMPGSRPMGDLPAPSEPPAAEVGVAASEAAPLPPPAPREPAVQVVPPPVFTPPVETETPPLEPASERPPIQLVSADGQGGEAAQAAVERRREAVEDLLNGWGGGKPPETTVVLTPAALHEPESGGPGSLEPHGAASHLSSAGTLLVPAGRGVYAHTVLAVNSDTNGPMVLEADTGPLAGDRMIASFTKSGTDRLVVKVDKVIHRGEELQADGLVVAPDSMETAVATSIDQHYAERFVLPAAAAFVMGMGQAVAMSDATTYTGLAGTSTTYGRLNYGQQALVGAGAAAQAIGNALTAAIPKGPTINLAANVSVGVIFLSNVASKAGR